MAGGGGAKQARKAKGRDAKNRAFKKGCAPDSMFDGTAVGMDKAFPAN